MKKFLLSLVALLMSTMMFASDALYSTLTFPATGQQNVSAYYKTWTGSSENINWKFVNFNNNGGQWKYIKGGTKNNPSVASMFTMQPVQEVITKFVVTVDALNKSYFNASYLEICPDTNFAANVEKVNVNVAVGEVTYTVPNPKANMCYRLSFDCAQSQSNGVVTISKVCVYNQDANVVSVPAFSVSSGNIYESTSLEITADAGATIYYSIDGGTYTKYTSPLTINKTMNVTAYAEIAGKKSEESSASYTFAKTYASISELIKETPTADGWPVVVPFENEKIVGFDKPFETTNGVYLSYVAGEQNFEFYCPVVPSEWVEGMKLSGIAKGVYKQYNGQWEISLVSWNGITASSDGVVLPPTISFDEETKTVTITPADPSYSTFYTLDGTEPTDASNVYEGPFTIEFSTIVKAISTNDDDEASAVATKECSVKMAGATLTDCATLVMSCTATSQDDATEVTFAFSNLLVTGVNGSNVFVSDATGSFLLYGKGATFVRGDKLSGNVKGQLYSYNNLPELSVSDWSNVTVASQGNAVTPAKADASAITKADASKFVRFEGLTFDSQAEVSKKMNYTLKQGDAVVVLRDNFGNLNDIAFNADCKYNLNVFVIPFKDEIQYYAVTADDIEVVSDKVEAENVFYSDWMINLTDGEFTLSFGADEEENDYYTKSDGARSFTSSDPSVATVDNNGVITPVAPGFTTITFHTASTAKYQEGVATMGLAVLSAEHENTLEDPFEVGDVKALVNFTQETDSLWVRGYIVGCVDGSFKNEKAFFGATEGAIDPVNTNILLSMNPNAKDVSECIPVELPKGKKIDGVEVRDILGLVSHPENLGKEIWIHANPEKYFSVPGLKGVNAYSWVGGTGSVKEDVNNDGKVNATDVMLVYNYILSATSPEAKAGEPCDVNGDGKVNATDIMVIYNYILAH